MTLLLGPPGSGKSTLLQALAGKHQRTNLKVSTTILSTVHCRVIPAARKPLLLGLHGSGKSTLVEALAGKHQRSNLKVAVVIAIHIKVVSTAHSYIFSAGRMTLLLGLRSIRSAFV